jgi:hypothetical protein
MGFFSKYSWRFFFSGKKQVILHWSFALEEFWNEFDEIICHFVLAIYFSTWNFILFSGVLFDQFVFDCNFFGFISSSGLGIIEDRLIVKLKD